MAQRGAREPAALAPGKAPKEVRVRPEPAIPSTMSSRLLNSGSFPREPPRCGIDPPATGENAGRWKLPRLCESSNRTEQSQNSGLLKIFPILVTIPSGGCHDRHSQAATDSADEWWSEGVVGGFRAQVVEWWSGGVLEWMGGWVGG